MTVLDRWTEKVRTRSELKAKRAAQVAYWSKQYHAAPAGSQRREHAYAMLKQRKDWLESATAQLAQAQRVVARNTRPTSMSDRGRDMLIREEGVVRYAYPDPAGHATFGVGHLLHLGAVTAADRAKYGTPAKPASMEKVREVLAGDLPKYEQAVTRATGGKLTTAAQFDACVLLCFNIGTGGFAGSTVARLIREGKPKTAADAFLAWDNPSMLRPRRERERRLFLTGNYA